MCALNVKYILLEKISFKKIDRKALHSPIKCRNDIEIASAFSIFTFRLNLLRTVSWISFIVFFFSFLWIFDSDFVWMWSLMFNRSSPQRRHVLRFCCNLNGKISQQCNKCALFGKNSTNKNINPIWSEWELLGIKGCLSFFTFLIIKSFFYMRKAFNSIGTNKKQSYIAVLYLIYLFYFTTLKKNLKIHNEDVYYIK